jgi:hypothetical protein
MTKESNFAVLNKLAKEHGIVLFGSTMASKVPVNELVQDFGLSGNIYNRSIAGLTLADAENHLDFCVFNLKPDKLLLCLGEEDLKEECDVSKLMEQYHWLLYKIHTVLPDTTLSLISVVSSSSQTAEFNASLRTLSQECGCEYLELPVAENIADYELRFFRTIKPVFFNGNMSFADAVQYCAI